MNSKSHTAKELKKARADNRRIFSLDTGSDGDDDLLLGNSKEDVKVDVENWLDGPMPEHWTVNELTWEQVDSYGFLEEP